MAALDVDEHLRRILQRLHDDLAGIEHDHVDDEVDAAVAAFVQLALPLRPAAPSPRERVTASPLLVTAFGMQMVAALTVDGRDRGRPERLCRYLLRPPFALRSPSRGLSIAGSSAAPTRNRHTQPDKD